MTRDRRAQRPVVSFPPTSAGNDMLQLETLHDDGTTTIVVQGEIDMLSAAQLEATLAEVPTERTVLVDMASVVFMDSSGLHVVLTESSRRLRAGGSLRVINESIVVTRLLDVSGVGFLVHAST